ncbi:MAG: helix-turn-helix transcriptional regulator [Pseudomonadota bacterium]
MRIIVRLDLILAQRKRRAKDLAAQIGITETNLSRLRNGKVSGVRFDTLARICAALDCVPGDILDFEWDAEESDDEMEAPSSAGPD